MQLARIAQSMVGVALVLFTLAEYDSPALAGLVTFASIFPGLLIAPVAGALLDRHGRVHLMMLDYVVALASLVLIGVLAIAGLLPPALLVLITIVTSITSILSIVGLRTLFPIMVPSYLWERVNAVDSNGYVVATIIGPPLAAVAVVALGAAPAMIAIALPFGLAAIALVGVREPRPIASTSGRLLTDAWSGVRYVWASRTLRGLGLSLTVVNLAGGMTTIVIPLLILRTLGFDEAMVGVVFAVEGVSGMIAATAFGRTDTRGREWAMLVVPLLLMAVVVALLLPVTGVFGAVAPAVGLGLVAVSMLLFGFLNGPLDIAVFTIRQRRTDPALLGRAFAVSMAFNFVGYPIGAALTGLLATNSLALAVALGIVAAVIASLLAAVLIPKHDPAAERLVEAALAVEAAAGRDAAETMGTGGAAADVTGVPEASEASAQGAR